MAELLIVVAIIAVLVAIAIPVFSSQLKKARLATNQANARSAYAVIQTELLEQQKTEGSDTYTVSTGKTTGTVGAASTLEIDAGIQDWTVETTTSSKKLGDEIAKTWQVSVDSTGKVTFKGGF